MAPPTNGQEYLCASMASNTSANRNRVNVSVPSPESEEGRLWELCRRWPTVLSAGLIVLATLIAYANSFTGPFIFDDLASIPDNPSIRQLSALGKVLSPPPNGETVSGRPLLNLSLAINYALAGKNTWDYHATNLVIHIVNALLLWSILRQTFRFPDQRVQFGDTGAVLALAIALLWALHPLQTESVTYIVQRAESLAAMFYLLTLYTVIRGTRSARPTLWSLAAVAACWLGMATKETMVTAPVVVLLYDRTFLGGSFGEAFRRRWGLYAGMAASWGLLAELVLHTGLLTRTDELAPPDRWAYAWSQPGVILHYLRLSLWPHPLCLDYDWPIARTVQSIGLPILVVMVLLGMTIVGLVRCRAWGFWGAWFFLILAPTSSFVPLRQLAFEHRMYLSLVAVTTLLVVIAYLVGRGMIHRGWIADRAAMAGGMLLLLTTAVMLAYLTSDRNEVYCTELSLWQDTALRAPHNARAHNTLGHILAREGMLREATEHYETALRLQPEYAEAHNNLGNALCRLNAIESAIQHYREALRLKPKYFEAHNNLGAAFSSLGRVSEAIEHYEHAVRIKPDYAPVRFSLMLILLQDGRAREAVAHGCEAARRIPDDPEIHQLTAWIMATQEPIKGGDPVRAVPMAERACALMGREHPATLDILGAAYAAAGRFNEAVDAASRARQLAEAGGETALVGQLDNRIKCYRDQKPYREPPPSR